MKKFLNLFFKLNNFQTNAKIVVKVHFDFYKNNVFIFILVLKSNLSKNKQDEIK